MIRNSVRKKKEMRLPKRPLIGRIEVVRLDPYESSTSDWRTCTPRTTPYEYEYRTLTARRGRTRGFRRLEDAVANAYED